MSKFKSFVRKHISRWAVACGLIALAVVANDLYSTIMSQLQMQTAVGQLKDSASAWILYYQVSYGQVFPNLVIIMTVLGTGLLLLPTIKDLLKLKKGK